MNDPYVTLGVSPTATDDEVKAAYRKLAMKYHPDRNQGSKEAEAKMKQVNDAYAQVMDMRKNGGRTTASGYGGSSTSGYGGYQQQQQQRQQQYGGYGGFDDFFGFGGYRQGGPYGGYQQGNTHTNWQQESPELTSVRDFLRHGQLYQARSILDGMRSRTATWYYLSALTHRGMGNQAAALSDARTAVQLEPDNMDFNDLLNRMEGPSRQYEQQGSPFGGMGAMLCQNPCISCCMLNMLINCCCGCRCCL